MAAYLSTSRSLTFDKLTNITGFDNAPAGTPYALVKAQEGAPYEPVVASAAVAIDPAGGLEENASDQLRIKIDNTSGDSGLGLSTDGLEVINRVKTAGDTMTGELAMSGNLVRGLPTNYPPPYSGDEATSWAQTVGLVSEAADTLLPLDGSEAMTGNLQLGGNRITGVVDPVNNQDATTKNYVDQAITNATAAVIELDIPILENLGLALYPSLRQTTFDTSDRVSAIDDPASGSQFVQSTQANQPLLQRDLTNNQWFLRFDGVDDFMEQIGISVSSIAGPSSNTTTVYHVAKAYNVAQQNHFTWSTPEMNFLCHLIAPWTNGNFIVNYNVGALGRVIVSGLPNMTGNIELWTFRTNGTIIEAYRGTGSTTPIGSGVGTSLSGSVLNHYCASLDGVTRFMEVDMYATYVFSSYHSDDQLHRMFTYFNEKYGV